MKEFISCNMMAKLSKKENTKKENSMDKVVITMRVDRYCALGLTKMVGFNKYSLNRAVLGK